MVCNKSILALALAVTTLFVSCDRDDDEPKDDSGYDIPSTYNFGNASYNGQLERLAMLGEMTSYLKTANSGSELDLTTLNNMYANENNPFGTTYAKQLKSKTNDEAVATIEAYLDSAASVSVQGANSEASDGVAGIGTTASNKSYMFAANGFEYTQLIEKGLMGACFYYQGTSVYLASDEGGVGADNETIVDGKDYTERQHHWDEAFGYFGAPIDLTADNVSDKIDAGEASYHAKYSAKAVSAGLDALSPVMEGFIAGRAAIDNNDDASMNTKKDEVIANWELVVACAAIHYLNGAKGSDYTDLAARCHQLSEAKAFVWSLYWNADKTMTISQIDEVIDLISDNFYSVSQADLLSATEKLATGLGIDDATRDAL